MGFARPSKWLARTARLALFAAGDFGFNLYWQSIMLFLLFYYTESLHLGVATAAIAYSIGSVWDGIVSLGVGVAIDRARHTRPHRLLVLYGALPLGIAFVLAYTPLALGPRWTSVAVLSAHLLLRTTYAVVNVPYLAMSSRITLDSGERALVAGMRMLFGTAAAVVVAVGTRPLGRWFTGSAVGASLYWGAAVAFAAIATTILVIVALTYREADNIKAPVAPLVRPRAHLAKALAANRAFVTLNAAMMAMIVGNTVLSKGILYYYKYFLHNEAAGTHALASIGVTGAIVVPFWVWASRRFGTRILWIGAGSLCTFGIAAFAALHVQSVFAMQAFLLAVQTMVIGMNFVFWAMLPDTIEFGEHATGQRVEGLTFGVAALLQRVAIGIATLFLGFGFGASGYVADVAQTDATLSGMRLTMIAVPLVFFGAAAAIMLINPLSRGAHAAIVRDLNLRRAQ